MKQTECICKISKAGKNLFARVPDGERDEINYGDKVKITVIEKATIKDPIKITSDLKSFLKSPNKEKLKGTIMGLPVEIDIASIIKNMPLAKAEKLFFDAIMK